MKCQILSFIFLIILLVSCSDNGSLEPISNSDPDLKDRIVGKWSNQYITYIFNLDGSFQKTTNYIIYSDSSTSYPNFIQGTYKIENSILIFNVTEWKLFTPHSSIVSKTSCNNNHTMYFKKEYLSTNVDSTNKLFPYASVSSFKIEFQEDLLYCSPLDILTSTSNIKDEIWGEWSTESWAIGGSFDAQSSLILGIVKRKYIFDKDSMEVTYGMRFSVDDSGEFDYWKEAMEYNHPDLKLGNNKWVVEYQNGKIYLFRNLDQAPNPLQKIR